MGGDTGNRTPDPLLAKQMLYQLSYVPVHRREHESPRCLSGETATRVGALVFSVVAGVVFR